MPVHMPGMEQLCQGMLRVYLTPNPANAADGSWQDSTVHKHFGVPAAAL